MNDQNFTNHPKIVKGYHYVLSLLLIGGVITAFVNTWLCYSAGAGLMNAILILLLFICCLLMAYFLRTFPLKAQDRAIRAEESLRYFILTGKPIDNKLTIKQIIALRFAPDEEYVMLANKAANEQLNVTDIKKAIKNWRADEHRL